ncbi:sulfite oxidase [Lapillicoccus sp.]|uniref:sulfite oxidase n=1 Tax=Lapillicoccus sp. TaxID=1909287 RepID=UPI0025E72C0B|nr:sulfite oxidase [Lapillicoccus sp.]
MTWDKRSDTTVHEQDPYNAEPSRAALVGHMITPADTFYSRNHGPIPAVAPIDWRLRVDGLVDTPLLLSLADLRSGFPEREVVATMQCAGARRADFLPVRDIPGEAPWGPCAISTARWTGVSLGDVLAAAGLRPETAHVSFAAPDVSQVADPPATYGSSIPVDKARSPEVLLAWAMNGEPLARVHGAPVRVVVPGYIGARSVKWVSALTASAAPSDNYFQSTAYRLLPADADPTTSGPGVGFSLGPVALNADILSPDPGTHVSPGATTVRGFAYAGDDRSVVRVDVSTDEGNSWRQATLEQDDGPWAWCLWQIDLELPPGAAHVLARAWDSTGACQPESAAALWNPRGYINNSWAHLDLVVQ